MKLKLIWLSLILAFGPSSMVFAQAPGSSLNPWEILSTVIYGVIGIALCVLGYFAFDRIASLDLQRELVEDQNVALGIMLAGVFIGIAIVVAAAVFG